VTKKISGLAGAVRPAAPSRRPPEAVESLSESRVVPALREAIVEGRLAPGSRLAEVELGTHFGVSRTPVREALAQLEREGLVVTVSRAGVYVRSIDARDVGEIYETREALEVQAVRLVARRLTRVGRAQLEDRLAALEATAHAGDPALYTAELDRFYDTVMELTGNATLRRSYEALSGPVRRLRRIAMRYGGRMAASVEHARAIVAAIASGDEDAAEREMRAQLRAARIAVTSVLEREQPG
jgi:DNA-binding GntR family transcriptional regulator